MAKTLIIAEKPSVGRDIARVLKCNKKGEGFLFSDEYIISWAVGHLVTLSEPEDYDKELKKWSFESLPIIPKEIKLKPIKNTKQQLVILHKLMNDKEVSDLICATDSGREGELIFRYIYTITKCKKPFKRLWISSMTDKAIKDGMANLKNGKEYDFLYYSAKCRSEADWLVGINASRAYTIKYDALLSIGRVQTPTLAILVERQKEINAFVSQEYYEIDSIFEEYKGKWFDVKTKDSKIFEKEKAEEIKQKLENKKGMVTDIEVEEKKQLPPNLYDLTELQRDANKKFGFSAQKTLDIAQNLYEKRKLITYPRTDSRYLSDDMIGKIKVTLGKLNNVDLYKDYASYILNLEKLPITKRIVDNTKITDHHAIIPTDININLSALSSDEFKIYDRISRRFLSVFYPPYYYNITRITTVSENENFITKGNTIIDLGYMTLYKDDKAEKKEDDDEETLPKVEKGQEFNITEINILEKKTKPPKNYTEASLLSSMENAGRFVEDEKIKEQLKQSGIGTPATRANIIERLLSVGYITRKGKNLIPTEKAMKLISVVPEQLRSPETTGKWEKGLNLIAKGDMETEKFMGSIKRYVKFLVADAKNSKPTVIFPEDKNRKTNSKARYLGKCPSCAEGQILENSKGFFCTRWKAGCKFTIWKNALEANGVNIDSKMVKELLKNKIVKNIEITVPNTQENKKIQLVFKDEKKGIVEIKEEK